MKTFASLQELKVALGQEVGASDWMEVTMEVEDNAGPVCIAENVQRRYG